MKLAGNTLHGHRNDDGSVSFVCDDCGGEYTYSLRTNAERHDVIGPASRRPWSITKRKQRCPDCTVIAREKGWVK